MDADMSAENLPTERSLVEASVKMHLHTLDAELRYLQETGEINSEIETMLASTASRVGLGPVVAGLKMLPEPRAVRVSATHTGHKEGFVVARPGDGVVVYALGHNGATALAYNEANETAGSMSTDALDDKTSRRPATEYLDVYAATEDYESESGLMSWRAGERVRVCKWDKYKVGGVCFNLSNGKIGRFEGAGTLKIIK